MSSSIQAKILEAKDVSKKGTLPKESENNGNEPTATPNTPIQNLEDKKNKGIIVINTRLFLLYNFFLLEAEKETPMKPKEKVVHDDMMFTDKQRANSLLLQEIVNKKKGLPNQIKAAPRKPGLAADYITAKGHVNYDKLLTDEILLADEQLVVKAKSLFDIAGLYIFFCTIISFVNAHAHTTEVFSKP